MFPSLIEAVLAAEAPAKIDASSPVAFWVQVPGVTSSEGLSVSVSFLVLCFFLGAAI